MLSDFNGPATRGIKTVRMRLCLYRMREKPIVITIRRRATGSTI